MVHKPPMLESIISFSFVSKSVYRVALLLSLVFAVIYQVSLLDLAFFVWEGYFYYYYFLSGLWLFVSKNVFIQFI